MATGTFTINVTIPVTGASDPDRAARGIVQGLLDTTKMQVGVGPLTGGNITYPTPATIIGSWAYTPST